jgi:FlaA1/EpsC-like NDP-sugar epimerase
MLLTDKTVLLTGGCGSFGGAFTSHALKQGVKALRIFDNDENGHMKMQETFTDERLRFFIGDVRDRGRLRRAMNDVDIVVHAAALKQVHLCEFNPIEAVRTNIEGSVNVIDTAIDCHVPKVLGISTDKSVHPINLYGATKLVMEKLFIQANVYAGSKFSCVRYGNFEGSRGSFLPLLYEAAESGKTIKLTHKGMSRFWIELDKVAEFALQCIEMMEGGEVFIPKMSERKVKELIETFAPQAEIKLIGKRKGEKLRELLFNEDEKPLDAGDYYVIKQGEI